VRRGKDKKGNGPSVQDGSPTEAKAG